MNEERCQPGRCRAGLPDGGCQADRIGFYGLCARARRDPDLWVPSIREHSGVAPGARPAAARAGLGVDDVTRPLLEACRGRHVVDKPLCCGPADWCARRNHRAFIADCLACLLAGEADPAATPATPAPPA